MEEMKEEWKGKQNVIEQEIILQGYFLVILWEGNRARIEEVG